MMLNQKHILLQHGTLIVLFSVLAIFSFTRSAFGQEDPPRPLEVYTYQNLSFGAMIQGNSGGEVRIDPQGSRSVTGDLILANMGHQYGPAVFEIVANPGAVITINNGPDIELTGSNGGHITMHIGTSIPSSPFVNTSTPPYRTQVRVGGILSVGNSLHNPSGDYIGYFSITFVQQ